MENCNMSFIKSWWIIEMKAKTKLLGVVCLVSIIALVASSIVVAGPENGYPDEPVGFDGSGAGPDNGYPDEPIGMWAGGAGPENGYPDEPVGGYAVG
jgi:hypothetical protein